MRRTLRTLSGMVGMGILGLVGWAGVAFACSVSPQVTYSLAPESATPGDTVTVEGRAVSSRSPVEIRWNGVTGKVLATATPTNGAFSVPVQVPDVSPGIYSLMLVTTDAGVGRTSIEVAALAGVPSQRVAAAQVWPTAAEARAAGASTFPGPAAVGVALLAVGLAGLFGASTFAVVRRRREPARV